MKEEFAELLRLRFDERNRRMIERFTEEKQRLNARGLLYSSETVKALHRVLETELKESAGVVVTGGVAELPGVAELAADVFGTGVRVGVPRENIGGLVDSVESPRFATVAGLAL